MPPYRDGTVATANVVPHYEKNARKMLNIESLGWVKFPAKANAKKMPNVCALIWHYKGVKKAEKRGFYPENDKKRLAKKG